MDQATAERIATALEAIAEHLRLQRDEPIYWPMGMAVVEKNSPEHRRAMLQERIAATRGGMPPPRPPS